MSEFVTQVVVIVGVAGALFMLFAEPKESVPWIAVAGALGSAYVGFHLLGWLGTFLGLVGGGVAGFVGGAILAVTIDDWKTRAEKRSERGSS